MSSDVLDRIDDAVTAWEARPESWVPGDPLYERPGGWLRSEQTIRPMIDLIPDQCRPSRCEPCGVGWRGPLPCWVCGEDRPEPERIEWRSPVPVTRFARVTFDLEPYRRVMQEAVESLAQMFEQYDEAFRAVRDACRTAERNGPEPLAVDGHAYRRKVRNRRKRR